MESQSQKSPLLNSYSLKSWGQLLVGESKSHSRMGYLTPQCKSMADLAKLFPEDRYMDGKFTSLLAHG